MANFVYTHCRETCPRLTARMRALQDRLRRERLLDGRVRLLSFAVDPARDTVPVLRAYADLILPPAVAPVVRATGLRRP